MSISRAGRSTLAFIRSIRLVPPAMNFAVGSAAIWRTASATSPARAYWKLIMAASFLLAPPGLLAHRLLDRRYDVGIGAAAADVAAHELANLIGARRPALGDQACRRADLSRRAIAALERVMIDEGLLQRMQRALRRQPFDGGHAGAVLHHGEGEAGNDPASVHQHRTRTALAVIAALLGAGEVEVIAQRVEQAGPRRDLELRRDAVDDQRQRDRVRRGDRLTRRSRALSCHLRLPFAADPIRVGPRTNANAPFDRSVPSRAARSFRALFRGSNRRLRRNQWID